MRPLAFAAVLGAIVSALYACTVTQPPAPAILYVAYDAGDAAPNPGM